MNATLRAGETYRLFGNRGTARYVGLQTMDGMAATCNVLVDDLEVDSDGNFEAIMSADERKGNWLRLAGDHPTLTVRNFLYDWDTEQLASLRIERIGDEVEPTDRAVDLDVSVSRQLHAVGEFVYDNLKFFLDFGAMPQPNDFVPPMDMSSMGAAAENRPVIGRWELRARRGADPRVRTAERPLLEHLARQPVAGDDPLRAPPVQPERAPGGGRSRRIGPLRALLAGPRRGELARHRRAQQRRNAPALRTNRDRARPAGTRREGRRGGLGLPAETTRTTPQQRAAVIEARRRAVHERFYR